MISNSAKSDRILRLAGVLNEAVMKTRKTVVGIEVYLDGGPKIVFDVSTNAKAAIENAEFLTWYKSGIPPKLKKGLTEFPNPIKGLDLLKTSMKKYRLENEIIESVIDIRGAK